MTDVSSQKGGGEGSTFFLVKILEMCSQNPFASATHRKLSSLYHSLEESKRLAGVEGSEKRFNETFSNFCMQAADALADVEEAVFAYRNPNKVRLDRYGGITGSEEIPMIADTEFFSQVCRYLNNSTQGKVKLLYLETLVQHALQQLSKKKDETTTVQKKRKREEISPKLKPQEEMSGVSKVQLPWSFQIKPSPISLNRNNQLVTMASDPSHQEASDKGGEEPVIASDFFNESLSPQELLALWERRERWRARQAMAARGKGREGTRTEAPDGPTSDTGATPDREDSPPPLRGFSHDSPLLVADGTHYTAAAPMAFVVSLHQFGIASMESLYPLE